MLAGHAPFVGDTMNEICLGHVRKPAPRATSALGEVSDSLATVIVRCLAKDPTKRYSSMVALAEALAVVEVA